MAKPKAEILDMKAACRLCLAESPDNSLIFQERNPSNSIALSKLISVCVGFEITQNYDLPSKLCNMCLQAVNQWAAFRAKSKSVNEVLSKAIYQKCTLISVGSKLKMIENENPKRFILPKETEASDLPAKNVSPINKVDLALDSKKKRKSKRILDKDSNTASTSQLKKKESETKSTAKSALTKDSEHKNSELKTFFTTFSEENTQPTSEAPKEVKVAQSEEVDNQTCVGLSTEDQQDDEDQEFDSDGGADIENNDDYEDDDDNDDNDNNSEDVSSEDDNISPSLDEDSDVPLEVAQDDVSKSWRQRTVKCPKCPKIFPKHDGMKFHLRRIHGLFKIYPCLVCGYTSDFSKKRENHIIKAHEALLNENPKCMCKICGLIVKTRVSCIRHMKIHKEERSCKVCNTVFKSVEECDIHSKTSHQEEKNENPPQNEGEPKFKCHLCEDTLFWNEKDWREHYRLIHFTQAVYPCDQCDKTYLTKEHLVAHKLSHTGEKPYMCEVCAGRFSSKASLRTHIKIHSNREYVCKVCQKKYTSYAGLYSHNRAEHMNIAPYVCHECGKKFKSSNGVLFHMRTHSGEKPYSCEHCEFTSKTYAGLYAHRVTHSDERPFKCDQCNKSFKLKAWLQVHQKTHTGVKNFVCEICNFSFIANYQLKSHMKVHSGERPHVCDICSKSFARRDTLTEHRRTHTKETKYTCKHCNLEFMFLKPFKKHNCTKNSNNSNLDLQETDSLLESIEEEDE